MVCSLEQKYQLGSVKTTPSTVKMSEGKKKVFPQAANQVTRN